MATKFYIKQNDTKPSLPVALAQDGSVVNLEGATVRCHMGSVVDAEAVITEEATGSVRYDFVAADTATIGSYAAEFQVTFSDGEPETFPNDDYLVVVVLPEVS